MKTIRAIIAIQFLIWIPALAAQAEDIAEQGKKGSIISESILDKDGKQRYNVIANSADLVQLLKDLFAKIGAQYAISQDVAGPVDLKRNNLTADEILKEVAGTASPPLVIERNKDGVYKVSRPPSLPVPSPLRPDLSRGPEGIVPVTPSGYGQFLPGNRPVTLDIPAGRQVPLTQVLSLMSTQTGFPIRLDRRVSDVTVTDSYFNQTPLNVALPLLAEATGLKLVVDNSHAELYPTDRFMAIMNDIVIGAASSQTCRSCAGKLAPSWKYCPNCGQPTGRGVRAPASKPGGPRSRFEKINRPF